MPHFPIRPNHGDVAAVRRQAHAGGALGRDGLGIAVAQVNQIIADSMPRLDSGGQQLFAVRQVAYRSVAYVVVGQLPGLAGTGWYQAQRPSLCGFGNYPLVIRRNCLAGALADPHRRRPVRIAQKYRVVRPAAFRLFLKQNFLAVTAYVSRQRPPEPSQFALRLFLPAAWRESRDGTDV